MNQLLQSFRGSSIKPAFWAILLWSLVWGSSLNAQRFASFDSKKYTMIGVSVAATNYFGDITPRKTFTSTNLSFTQPTFGIMVMRKVSPNIFVQGSFSWLRIGADDFESASASDINGRYRFIRNQSFRNTIKELSVGVNIDLISNRHFFFKRPKLVPFVHVGLAVFQHNPQARLDPETAQTYNLSTDWTDLQPLGTEGQGFDIGKKKYSLIQFAIPFGFGVRYRVSDRVDLAFEVALRQTFTDYLDDVSSTYPSAKALDQMSVAARVFSNRTLASKSSSGQPRNVNEVIDRIPLSITNYGQTDQLTVEGFNASDQRGKRSGNDQYVVAGFMLHYVVFKGVRCPKF
jgi:hypothetical protein